MSTGFLRYTATLDVKRHTLCAIQQFRLLERQGIGRDRVVELLFIAVISATVEIVVSAMVIISRTGGGAYYCCSAVEAMYHRAIGCCADTAAAGQCLWLIAESRLHRHCLRS